MNIRALRYLGVVSALAGAMFAASMANASIVEGSKVRIFGHAIIDAAGNITPLDEDSGLTVPEPVKVLISASGNLLSYAGYNRQNPSGSLFPGQYFATLHPIVATGPHGVLVLSLPSVVSDPVEPGPPVAATFFVMDSWTGSTSGTFFTGIGLGRITDGHGTTVSGGRFEISSPAVQIGQPTSFSATLIASTIPVPGAMWIFGSGLLLMTAVMRRRVK